MKKFFLWIAIVLSLSKVSVYTYNYSFDFDNCDLKDIVFAVSCDTGISICCDDTVSGKGSWKFSGEDLDTALNAFLMENRLYVIKESDRWVITRFGMEISNDSYDLDVFDLTALQILEKISMQIDEVISFDSLPSGKISLHFHSLSKSELFDALAKRFGDYEVRYEKNLIDFVKLNKTKNLSSNESHLIIDVNEDGRIFVDLKNVPLQEGIEELFEHSITKYDFCFLSETNPNVIRTSFCANNIDSALTLLCSQNGYECIEIEDVYYFCLQKNKTDELINGQGVWKKHELKYISFNKISALINRICSSEEIILLTGDSDFLCKCSSKNHDEIDLLIYEMDVPLETFIVELKYLRPSDFIKCIPPGFNENDFKLLEKQEVVFYTGTREEFDQLKVEVAKIDKPELQIRYDLLILQYDDSSQNSWATNFTAGRIIKGDRNNLGVQLGSVMNFNLDVISAFGLSFASKLQASIEENKTSVFADTTLYGISGREINFQNTSTYRYRDNNLDPETGKPVYTGITREIISGIRLDICGWVSGDGIITSKVCASISRQGLDTSSSTGNPPPTIEKLVTTEVCGKTGEPIILSGLVQTSSSSDTRRVPLISRIPLLGKLFRNDDSYKEKTQMVIYLVPHVLSLDEKENRKEIDPEKFTAQLEELKMMLEEARFGQS
ncbi:MAG: type II and III secretion system protein [Treponema sp.]|nr:type II and III secretion system protein [Treponema sp.]